MFMEWKQIIACLWMQIISALKIVGFLWLLPLTGFAEQDRTPSSLEEMINSFNCERCRKEISFKTNVPVDVECAYPVFSGKGAFVEYVNKQLKKDAEDRFVDFICGEISAEDVWDEGYALSYDLSPVYQTSNLVSVFGCNFQGRGGHGCSYYEGKTFWQRENSISELVLDDLFLKGSGHREFLLQYCENNFKASGYGYYSSRAEFPPELSPSDLDIFVLTDEGLMIVFRAYTVGGWADGPDTVLIPYTKLQKFIRPHGPLKAMLK